MCRNPKKRVWNHVACLSLVVSFLFSSGCATLAHRGKYDPDRRETVQQCDGTGEICPWLAADFALLLAGVVPGVIALAVDFSSGDWKH